MAKYKWTWIFELVWDIAFHWIPISSKSLNQVLFYIYLELLVHPSETPYEVCNSLKIIWISALKHHCALIFGAASDLLPNSLRYSSSLHLRDPISLTALSPVRRSQQATILMIVVWNQSLENPWDLRKHSNMLLYLLWGIAFALLAVWESVFFKLALQGAAVIALLSN